MGWTTTFQFPAVAVIFYFISVSRPAGAHQASYPKGARGRVVEAWSWTLNHAGLGL